MKTLLAGAAIFGILAGPARADSQYDHSIEQAAIDIVVGKIGTIRGGFSFDVRTVSMIAQNALATGSVIARDASPPQGDAWRDGLAPAVERKGSRIVF